MPKLHYKSKRFSPKAFGVIDSVNRFIRTSTAQGFRVSLRQCYYHLVAHDLFPDDMKWSWVTESRKWVRDPEAGTKNADPNYGWLGDVVSEGRMAGLIDWEAVEDRGRFVRTIPSWDSPADVVEAVSQQFKLDLWADQSHRPEVWIEKDALVGVIEPVCRELRVPFFSCRGYSSLSAMWEAAQRFYKQLKAGKRPVVLHLGDHDPSGIDMTRDIENRLNIDFISMDWLRDMMSVSTAKMSEIRDEIEAHVRTLGGGDGCRGVRVLRLALNMDQVEAYGPPPNPTKLTDSRAKKYLEQYGEESWELDALPPASLADLIREHVGEMRDEAKWEAAAGQEAAGRKSLARASGRWPDVEAFLKTDKKKGK